jgi:hypothetical protein
MSARVDSVASSGVVPVLAPPSDDPKLISNFGQLLEYDQIARRKWPIASNESFSVFVIQAFLGLCPRDVAENGARWPLHFNRNEALRAQSIDAAVAMLSARTLSDIRLRHESVVPLPVLTSSRRDESDETRRRVHFVETGKDVLRSIRVDTGAEGGSGEGWEVGERLPKRPPLPVEKPLPLTEGVPAADATTRLHDLMAASRRALREGFSRTKAAPMPRAEMRAEVRLLPHRSGLPPAKEVGAKVASSGSLARTSGASARALSELSSKKKAHYDLHSRSSRTYLGHKV